jgi:hypothetical protein
MAVPDLTDMFLPQPDDLLSLLSETRDAFAALLTRLPGMFASTQTAGCALGAALQAAVKLTVRPILLVSPCAAAMGRDGRLTHVRSFSLSLSLSLWSNAVRTRRQGHRVPDRVADAGTRRPYQPRGRENPRHGQGVRPTRCGS